MEIIRTAGAVQAGNSAYAQPRTPRRRKAGTGHRTGFKVDTQAVDLDKLSVPIPEVDQRLIDSKIQKLCIGPEWQDRRLILSSTHLVLAHWKGELVNDTIPLYEIPLVKHSSHKSWTEDLLKRQRSEGQSASISDALVEDLSTVFEVHTEEHGHNSGRTYFFRAETNEECNKWVSMIKKHNKKELQRLQNLSLLQNLQARCAKTYDSTPMKVFVTLVIISNFLAAVVETSIRPEKGSQHDDAFLQLDIFYTVLFTLELCFNAFGNWFWPFFENYWNWFDTLVVALSIASLGLSGNSWVKSVRLIRAFRVLRLIRQLASLRKIVTSLIRSLFPVLNAFVVAVMVQSIYAVAGVNFFGDDHVEHFGSFASAMFTLLQISSLDSWSTLARSMFDEPSTLNSGVVVYFSSYIMIVGYTLLSVVVAVLIENFSQATRLEEQILKEKDIKDITPTWALDPLLQSLINTEDEKDLAFRIAKIYRALDVDSSGDLTFEELTEGLKKLEVEPRIHLAHEDYVYITKGGQLCGESGALTFYQFETIIREQLKLYLHRQLSTEIALEGNKHGSGLICCALKQIHLSMGGQGAEGFELMSLPSARSQERGEQSESIFSETVGPSESATPKYFGADAGPTPRPTQAEATPRNLLSPSALQHPGPHLLSPKAPSSPFHYSGRRGSQTVGHVGGHVGGHVVPVHHLMEKIDLLTSTMNRIAQQQQHLESEVKELRAEITGVKAPSAECSVAPQPLSHSATQPLALSATQPLSHSAPGAGSDHLAQQPGLEKLGAERLRAKELSNGHHQKAAQPLSHSATQPLSPSAAHPLGHFEVVSGYKAGHGLRSNGFHQLLSPSAPQPHHMGNIPEEPAEAERSPGNGSSSCEREGAQPLNPQPLNPQPLNTQPPKQVTGVLVWRENEVALQEGLRDSPLWRKRAEVLRGSSEAPPHPLNPLNHSTTAWPRTPQDSTEGHA